MVLSSFLDVKPIEVARLQELNKKKGRGPLGIDWIVGSWALLIKQMQI